MNETLISNSNSVVKGGDVVIHAGDFTLTKNRKKIQQELIDRLNGNHVFLKGSHDYWLPKNKSLQRWEGVIEDQYVVVDHYNMRTWARSHYNSWQLYGHSHGKLDPVGKQWDIGVDNNNFFPVSFDQIKEIMEKRPDNLSFIRLEERRHGSRRS
jgi:calcineurin-like phosphoesterase family protein